MNESEFNPLDKIREITQKTVNETNLPTRDGLGYESTVGVYGGKLNYDVNGKLVYDMSGPLSRFDRAGDVILRSWDEHIIRHPAKMLQERPFLFFKFLVNGPKRHRGIPVDIARNIHRLGLEDYYGLHPRGIEVKRQELFKYGRPLQDIYRADEIRSDQLTGIDRFQALEEAAKYIGYIHRTKGAVGELLPSDIIFQGRDGDRVVNPVLNIPDIIYDDKDANPDKTELKATDILDFLANVGVEELHNSGDWENVKKAFDVILAGYKNADVIRAANSLAKRGRLILGDEARINGQALPFFNRLLRKYAVSQHNKARLGVSDEIATALRSAIIKSTE